MQMTGYEMAGHATPIVSNLLVTFTILVMLATTWEGPRSVR